MPSETDVNGRLILNWQEAQIRRRAGVLSKRRQEDRRAAMVGLFDRARHRGITFSEDLITQVEDGFGASGDGEDAFDALVGILGMIEVTDGRRMERPVARTGEEGWEGWILGQAA
jgi:hypothetical protein